MNSPTLQIDALPPQYRDRIRSLQDSFNERWKKAASHAFSVPGRIEILGNHTDHNHGKVIAAAIDMDMLAVLAPHKDAVVTVQSRELKREFQVDLTQLSVNAQGDGNTEALIRGVAAGFTKEGYAVGGFNAIVESSVAVGSGLSSSAAFEVLIGIVFSHLYNHAEVPLLELAKIAQFAENAYAGKPSGLMDQIACAYGGVLHIDFASKLPEIHSLPLCLDKWIPSILMTEEGHEQLTSHYGAIPKEMHAVARQLHASVLREVSEDAFRAQIPDLRKNLGDRACMRAIHFFEENSRVDQGRQALHEKNIPGFFDLIRASSYSSWCLLQNVSTYRTPQSQELAMALTISESFFRSLPEALRGACRVHGGGFAGTMLIFLHEDSFEAYQRLVAQVFGTDRLCRLATRSHGCVEITLPQEL